QDEPEPTRRPWSASEAALEARRAAEDQATRDRADDGRSAFGVRTDVVGTAPWDRDSHEEPAGRASEVRELRPLDGSRPPVDRGAPEDWSTTPWGPPESGSGSQDWGGGDGRSADVLPFDLSSTEGDRHSSRTGGGRARRPETN